MFKFIILDFDGVPSPQLALSPSVSSSQLDLDSRVMSAFRKECTVSGYSCIHIVNVDICRFCLLIFQLLRA